MTNITKDRGELQMLVDGFLRGERVADVRAAMKWLRRYLEPKSPRLTEFAEVVRKSRAG